MELSQPLCIQEYLMKAIKTIVSTASLLFTSSALAQRPPLDSLTVRQIAYAGSGCPATSSDGSFSERDGAIRLNLGSFGMLAQAGPGISLRDSRKACQLLIDLDHPTDWQYRLVGIAYSGQATLENGAIGNVRTTTYFQGELDEASANLELSGEMATTFSEFATFDDVEVWSPCGIQRALNVKIAASVQASGGANGSLSLTDPLGLDPQSIVLEFRPCIN